MDLNITDKHRRLVDQFFKLRDEEAVADEAELLLELVVEAFPGDGVPEVEIEAARAKEKQLDDERRAVADLEWVAFAQRTPGVPRAPGSPLWSLTGNALFLRFAFDFETSDDVLHNFTVEFRPDGNQLEVVSAVLDRPHVVRD